MKTLQQYLCEDKEIVVMRLESNYEEALKYFNEYNIFRLLRGDHKLDESDLKMIFDYADEYKMPSPLVLNYGHKPGKFAFRRWVAQLQEELSNFDLAKAKSPYQGLHNTNLKEDNSYFPSSSDYEYVISYGANKLNDKNLFDDDNISIVFGKDRETGGKMDQIILFYDQNAKSIDNICKNLNEIKSPLYKLPNEGNVTKDWEKLGEYSKYNKKPNNTPKTDIISKDGKYKLSLKKYNGAQLMSGKQCEARATVMSCIDKIKNETEKHELMNIFNTEWYHPEKGKTIKELMISNPEGISNAKNDIKNNEKKFRTIVQNNPDFEEALLKEAITGEIKFGKNNKATANYVFVWDDLGKNSELYNIDEYMAHIKGHVKYSISFKTSGINPSSDVSLRIIA